MDLSLQWIVTEGTYLTYYSTEQIKFIVSCEVLTSYLEETEDYLGYENINETKPAVIYVVYKGQNEI